MLLNFPGLRQRSATPSYFVGWNRVRLGVGQKQKRLHWKGTGIASRPTPHDTTRNEEKGYGNTNPAGKITLIQH